LRGAAFPSPAGAALLVALLAPFAAAAEPLVAGSCDLEPGATGRVASVPDAVTLVFESGDTVRLAAIAPLTGDDGTAALEALAAGQDIRLMHGDVASDRYGRAVAQAFLADGRWIQAELLQSGNAVVVAADERQCLAELHAFEQAGRETGAGYWDDNAIPGAWSPDIRNGPDRYAVVEGRVESIGRTGTTVYLNFGRNWSEDLTVTIRSDDADIIENEAGTLDQLVGALIRARGWLSQRDGPWIGVDHGGQIEVLSAGNAAVAD